MLRINNALRGSTDPDDVGVLRVFDALLDILADYCLACQEAGVPVMLRPFHENSGDFFWWGVSGCERDVTDHVGSYDPQIFIENWRHIVDYVEAKGVHNVLWEYSPNGADFDNLEKLAAGKGEYRPYRATYPGDDYVDIMAFDDYGDINTVKSDIAYVSQFANERGKVGAGSEVNGGNILPFLEAFGDPSVNMSYFLQWTNMWPTKSSLTRGSTGSYSARDLIGLFNDDRTVFARGTRLTEYTAEVTVAFDPNGGSAVADAVTHWSGLVPQPADPTKDGFAFAGWYASNDDGAAKWDFAAGKAFADMTLYARWAAQGPRKVSAGIYPAPAAKDYAIESLAGAAAADYTVNGVGVDDFGTLNFFIGYSAAAVDAAGVKVELADALVGVANLHVNVVAAPLEGYEALSVTVYADPGKTITVPDGGALLNVSLPLKEAKAQAVQALLSHFDAAYAEPGADGALVSKDADAAIAASVATVAVTFHSRFDVNRDGKVTLADVNQVRQYLGASEAAGWPSDAAKASDIGSDGAGPFAGGPDGAVTLEDLMLVMAAYEATVA
jgi:uncharacterized repeat protein (TIGR02543 family)